jgi:hypothetical protein
MTDRLKGVVVTFDRDYRDDDVEFILNAIRMIKGVCSVDPLMAEHDDLMNRQRLKHEMRGKLYDAIAEVFDPKKPTT